MDVVFYVACGVGGICFIIQAIFETQYFNYLRDNDTRRNIYPLNIESCTQYKVNKLSGGFKIQNIDSTLHYKVFKGKKHWTSQDWKIVDENNPRAEEAVATIHKVESWFFGKEYIHFPLISSPIEPMSNSAPLLSEVQHIRQVGSPYIDLALQQNFVRQRDLGTTVLMSGDVELRQKETRKLHTVLLHEEAGSQTSHFHILKNSMEYKWNLNGYLEKSSKNKINPATERIGFIKVDDDSQYTVYLNEDSIDPLLGLSTCVLKLLHK